MSTGHGSLILSMRHSIFTKSSHYVWSNSQNCPVIFSIICRFVDTHYQLVPYLLTTGAEALEANSSSITPLASHESFVDKVSIIVYTARFRYFQKLFTYQFSIIGNEACHSYLSFGQNLSTN